MKRFLKNAQLWMIAAVCAVTLNACGGDDDDPEIVPDPMDTAEYYIAGAVYDYETSAAVSGVTVTAGDASAVTGTDGSYQLTVKDKQKYTVAFAKTGYLSQNSTAELASSAQNRATVFLSVKLSAKGVEKTVSAAGGMVGNKDSDAASTVGIQIPAGAIGTGSATISVTPVSTPVPASTTVTTGTQNTTLSLGELHIESSKNAFDQAVSLVWKNAATATAAFSSAKVFSDKVPATKAPVGYTDLGNAVLDGLNYMFSVTQLYAGYSLEANVKVATNTGKEINKVNGQDEVTVDNSGKTEAVKDLKLNVEQKAGWTYTTSPTQALTAAGVSGADLATMAATISRGIENTEGGAPALLTIPGEDTASISGGYIMHYKNEATFYTRTYTFDIATNGQTKSVAVVVKHYTGSVTTYSNVDAAQHSGGKSN